MRRLLTLLTTLSLLGSIPGRAAPLSADQLMPVVQGALARCGQKLALSEPVSRAARDYLLGKDLRAALRDQGYAAFEAQGWLFEFHGNTAALAQMLGQTCQKLKGLTAYGFSTDGDKLALIAAREAAIDLSQKSRWLNEFLALTNKARAQARKCGSQPMQAAGPLKWDSRLTSAAERHAADMVQQNFRGHVNPVTGTQPYQRAQAAGFNGSVGENLAYGMLTPQDAVKELLNSPKHCENLMEPRWQLFGAAIANGTASTLFPTYWVQVFGGP